MTLLHRATALGELPHYVAPDHGAHATTLRGLLGPLDDGASAVDPVGLRAYFARQPDGERTCFQGARLVPAGFDLRRSGTGIELQPRAMPDSTGPLLPHLEAAVSDVLARARRPVVALSGGLDSALVLALVNRLTERAVPVVTLATGLPGYCELEATLDTARALGARAVDVIRVDASDFIAALPDAIAACETPLFNLHPVSKLLLARAVAARGHDALITGDGADQVFAGADGRNYLPIVGALVRSTGMTLESPFFAERIVGWARRNGTDPDKTALRQAAAAILPSEVAARKKTARLAPDFDVSPHRDAAFEAPLAATLGMPRPAPGLGPQQTLWATAGLLLRQLGGTC